MSFDMEIEDYMEDLKLKKKCIVTGGAGFIGSHIVDRLIKDGHEVHIIDDLSTGKKENINPKAHFHQRDLSVWNYLDLFEGVDLVFHLACLARVQPSIEEPHLYHDKNVNGLVNVLEACRIHKVKRVVFSSSSSVYGDVEEKDLPTSEFAELNPMSPYAIHKFIGEEYCKLYSKLYDIETVSLRYFNVYGERQSLEGAYCLVMGIFAQQRLRGEPMTINGNGNQRRDFTYVGDVVDANIRAATSDKVGEGEVINIGNGENRSVNQLANLIGGYRTHREPVIEPFATLANNKKAKRLLGWKPTMVLEDWVVKYKKDLGLN